MFAFGLNDLVWTVGAIVVLGGLLWFAFWIEPHWAAKDGKAFTCKIQPMRASGRIEGRWRDARATVGNGEVKLVVKGVGRSVTPYIAHQVLRQSESSEKRRVVFVLSGEPMYLLRIPKYSKAVPVLQSLITSG